MSDFILSPEEEQSSELQSSPCLQGERVAFTGILASMTHRQAQEIVVQNGGTWTHNVSHQTTMLIIGEEGWPLDPDGQPSQKLQQVTTWRGEGIPIRLVNESDWLHLLGLEDQRREVHRLYTPAMLSQLLGLPVALIRKWERLGLIKPEKRVYRLPYFDFQEVTSARRLSELLASGVSPREIEAGLKKLQMFSDVGRSLAQLDLLAQDKHLLLRDQSGLIAPRTGQRYFDFESGEDLLSEEELEAASIAFPPNEEEKESQKKLANLTANDWYQQGCLLLEEDEPQQAIEAFRCSLMQASHIACEDNDVQDHLKAQTHFCLAEALYRRGKREAALERYFMAVEVDRNYLEAWTQIGCIQEEQQELEAALEAFQIALEIHPYYPDAHLHRAEVLHQLGRNDEAIPHWHAYLEHDQRGPWAEKARERLAELGEVRE